MNDAIRRWYGAHEDEVRALSDEIWAHPELALHEFYACRVSAEYLRKWGFSVETFPVGGAEEPNTVVAQWGSGSPVIGIVGEYDALDNLGQRALPYQSVIPGPGHGCGHNLMGAGCAGAAAALKAAMEAENLPGTVKYFACPAEEILAGKILMDKLGCFDGLDICLAWHPGGKPPAVSEDILMSCGNWIFEFFGKTAHAAGQPWLGRSALDAAELMNIGAQFLREHVTGDVRLHYAFKDCNAPANVVPEYAAVNYIVRANKFEDYQAAAARVVKIAEGAAMMTETRVRATETASCCESKLNHTLNRALYEAAMKIPQIAYTPEEYAFAAESYRNAMGQAPPPGPELLQTAMAAPSGKGTFFPGSSDLNQVMKKVPTAQIFSFGSVNNTIGHHWCQTAAGGMSIGHKGAIFAGKCLAQCGYDLLKAPALIESCRDEFNRTP